MELDPSYIIIGAAIVFIIGVFVMMWQNPISKAAFLSRTRKKNYGVIFLLTKGKKIAMFIQDLSEPIYRFRNMVIDPQKQNPFAVYSIGIVPVMFYYDTKSSPVVLETKVKEDDFDINIHKEGKAQALPILIDLDLKMKAESFNDDPNALFAAFTAYSELLRKQMAFKLQSFFMLLVGACLVGAIAAYFGYDNGNKIAGLEKQLVDMKAILDALKALSVAPISG